MSVALKAATWAWRFKETKNDSPVHRTPAASTPRYLGHRGVWTPRFLGLFWIFSGSGFATPRYIGHRGV